jgi:hypothetical protein
MVPLLIEARKPFLLSLAIVAFSAFCGNLLASKYGVVLLSSAS